MSIIDTFCDIPWINKFETPRSPKSNQRVEFVLGHENRLTIRSVPKSPCQKKHKNCESFSASSCYAWIFHFPFIYFSCSPVSRFSTSDTTRSELSLIFIFSSRYFIDYFFALKEQLRFVRKCVDRELRKLILKSVVSSLEWINTNLAFHMNISHTFHFICNSARKAPKHAWKCDKTQAGGKFTR